MVINAVAIIIGYLLGSIPSAYIITRAVTGKDVRQLGSGNVGALNTFREVGPKAGIAVFLADVSKGVAIIAIAKWGLGIPGELFLLLAGLATVVGQMWPVFLRFTGGRGMATIFGFLAIFMPLHGYLLGFLIFLGVLAISLTLTRGNFALCMIVGLASIPISTWFLVESRLLVIFATVLLVLALVRVMPIARAAWARSKNVKDFIRGQ